MGNTYRLWGCDMRLISQDGWDETCYDRSDIKVSAIDDGFYIVEVTKEKASSNERSEYAVYHSEEMTMSALFYMRNAFMTKQYYFKFPTISELMEMEKGKKNEL